MPGGRRRRGTTDELALIARSLHVVTVDREKCRLRNARHAMINLLFVPAQSCLEPNSCLQNTFAEAAIVLKKKKQQHQMTDRADCKAN